MFTFIALLAAQEVLTDESILKMVKAGVPDDVIVEMIKSQPGHYVVTTDHVIELKKQGVSGRVLAAMVAKDSAATTAPPASAEAPALPPAPVGAWELEQGQDRMSNEPRVYASRTFPAADGRGAFRVDAICQPKAFLNIELSYKPKTGNVALKPTRVDRETTSGLGESAHQYADCVLMRLRIGDGAIRDAVSDECDTPNNASIFFKGNLADRMNTEQGQKTMGAMAGVFGSGSSGALGQLLNSTMSAGGPMMDRMDSTLGIGRMADIFAAPTVKIEAPLSDGSYSILEIEPQDPSFELFASQCGEPISDPRRGYLGASIGAVTPEAARQAGARSDRGIVVNEVLAGGPAAQAGLRAGDVITTLDSKPVDNTNRFTVAILSHAPGSTARMEVLRDGAPIRITATIGRRPELTQASAPQQGPARPATPVVSLPQAPVFNGTAESFAAAFPDFLSRAAEKDSLNPADFDKESALIVEAVRACARITPQMAASTARFGAENLAALGDQYKLCQRGGSSNNVKTWDPREERGIIFQFMPAGPLAKWQNGMGFTVSVSFAGNKALPVPIVSAMIAGP